VGLTVRLTPSEGQEVGLGQAPSSGATCHRGAGLRAGPENAPPHGYGPREWGKASELHHQVVGGHLRQLHQPLRRIAVQRLSSQFHHIAGCSRRKESTLSAHVFVAASVCRLIGPFLLISKGSE
jgi:hypothetical protein